VFQHNRVAIARSVERSMNGVQNPLDILDQLVIPKAEHAISFPFKPSRAHVIARFDGGVSML
jgi:hypothetical protein